MSVKINTVEVRVNGRDENDAVISCARIIERDQMYKSNVHPRFVLFEMYMKVCDEVKNGVAEDPPLEAVDVVYTKHETSPGVTSVWVVSLGQTVPEPELWRTTVDPTIEAKDHEQFKQFRIEVDRFIARFKNLYGSKTPEMRQ